jgi:hypothetical protein
MPQFLVIVAVGAGLYAGARLVQRIAAEVSAGAEAVRAAAQRAAAEPVEKDLGRLEYDVTAGVYRPAARN